MAGITKTTQFQTEGKAVNPRAIDFVSRFAANWDALMNLYGIMRPIKKTPGTILRAYTAKMVDEALATSPAEGQDITFTQFGVEEAKLEDLTIEKYGKAVTIEAVEKYGVEIAIQKTDEEFLNQLQLKVQKDFYTFLKTGTLVGGQKTLQAALAAAKGAVIDKFAAMQKTVTEVVGFANIYDVYDYLGEATVTLQTAFGLTYVQNFLGYKTLFLLPDNFIAPGHVYATPVENIDLYYIDPADSAFAQLGLEYEVDGVTNLLGFAANGNYRNATGEAYAIMGMKLWAEYLDGIAAVEFGTSVTKKRPAVAKAPGQE